MHSRKNSPNENDVLKKCRMSKFVDVLRIADDVQVVRMYLDVRHIEIDMPKELMT